MKKIFLLFILAAFAIISCNCEPEEQNNELLRKWKLVRTSGTLHGNGIETDWNLMELTQSKAIFYKDNTKLEEATYTLSSTDSTIVFLFNNKTGIVGDLKNDPEKNYSIYGGNTLEMKSDCCDRVDYELKAE